MVGVEVSYANPGRDAARLPTIKRQIEGMGIIAAKLGRNGRYVNFGHDGPSAVRSNLAVYRVMARNRQAWHATPYDDEQYIYVVAI